jgi:hypothetical protein
MNDEKLITKFLERHYKVIIDDTYFKIIDKETEKKYHFKRGSNQISNFSDTFKTIFGVFTSNKETSLDILYKWISFHQDKLIKNLSDYVKTLNLNEGSTSLLFKTINRFSHGEDSNLYSTNFITEYITDYYNENSMIPFLKKIIKEFNPKLGSVELIKHLSDRLETETTSVYEFALDYLNKWYCDNVIGDKMKDFLSQLVITLGSRNWIVTWIGHGPISKDKILSLFKDEESNHHEFIMKTFDNWYEIAVIEASEREMNRNNYGSSFPGVNLERNF